LFSREVLDEYLRVLSYPKFELSEKEIKELIQRDPSLHGSGQAKKALARRPA
jgi:predicted nucleic acid-binding protein